MDTPFSTWATVEEASSTCTLLPQEPPPRIVPPLQLPSNARQALDQHFQQQQQQHYSQQQLPVLTEAPTRRMSSLISTLASIDELEPLLLDDLAPAVVIPPPPLAQRLTASQVSWQPAHGALCSSVKVRRCGSAAVGGKGWRHHPR